MKNGAETYTGGAQHTAREQRKERGQAAELFPSPPAGPAPAPGRLWLGVASSCDGLLIGFLPPPPSLCYYSYFKFHHHFSYAITKLLISPCFALQFMSPSPPGDWRLTPGLMIQM